MTFHEYLPTLILFDKVSQFRSEIVVEITNILEIQIRHASTKHAQTFGILERTHASIKTAHKISTRERRSTWHQYVQIACTDRSKDLQYDLPRNSSLRTAFHGRITYNVLDIKVGIKPKWNTRSNSDIVEQLQKQVDEVRARQQKTLSCCPIPNTKNNTTIKRLQPRLR